MKSGLCNKVKFNAWFRIWYLRWWFLIEYSLEKATKISHYFELRFFCLLLCKFSDQKERLCTVVSKLLTPSLRLWNNLWTPITWWIEHDLFVAPCHGDVVGRPSQGIGRNRVNQNLALRVKKQLLAESHWLFDALCVSSSTWKIYFLLYRFF